MGVFVLKQQCEEAVLTTCRFSIVIVICITLQILTTCTCSK